MQLTGGHCGSAKAVKSGHRGHRRALTGNRAKLAALVYMFDVPIRVVAKKTGFSRTYIARAVSPNDSLQPSPRFFRQMEGALNEIIGYRRRAFFQVESVDAAEAERMLQSLG